MRRPLPSLLLLCLSLIITGSLQAQTLRNIAVLQADASANNTSAHIVQLNTTTAGQTPVGTFAIDGTILRFSGSATSTGYLANSNDGTLLCFTGANSTNTTSNVNTLNPRGVGILDASQHFTVATTYAGISGNQTRCATTLDNNAFFIGDQGGSYTNNSVTPDPAGNLRGEKAFGGVVYVGQQSASIVDVCTLASATGASPVALSGLSPDNTFQDFYLVSSGANGSTFDILYIISNTSATAGTIKKFSLVSGTWTANGSYTTTFGGFGIAAQPSGTSFEIYVSTGAGATTANSVVKCTDLNGFNSPININTPDNVVLYTAPAGAIVKGVAFAPLTTTPLIRITEFMYDGLNGEFVELTNIGHFPIDMTGWSFDDDSHTPGTVSLGSFGVVQPGESVLVTDADPATFRTAWGLCSNVKVLQQSAANLSRNDEINVYDALNNQVDKLTYGDQNFTGTIRTQNKSGKPNAAGLGANVIADWSFSTAGDADGTHTSTLGDLGSPGKSTFATVSFNPCTVTAGAPTIVVDVTNTSDLLDGGVTTSPASHFGVSGVLSDPTDPASTKGIFFTIGDDATPVANLTVTVTSSNTTIVPNTPTNLSLTNGADASSRLLTITPTGVGRCQITVTVNDGTQSTDFVLEYGASAAGPTGSVWPTGIADASAAIPIDDNYMVIGDDESNLLYLYNRAVSGLPVKTFDLNPGNTLGLTDGSAPTFKEVDIEAAAASPVQPTRTYWFGSMSNSSNSPFDLKPNRDQIIAVNATGAGAATTYSTAAHFAGLRAQLISWGDAHLYDFTTSAHPGTSSSDLGTDPKTPGGFNIEGVAFAPDNTTLYIGFRAPLVPMTSRTRAVIAPIANFETWFNNGAPSTTATIGEPIELDLGGRGIRDIVRLPNNMYVILAGSTDGTPNPAAYRWTGNPGDAPVQLASFDLTGQNAEAALPVNEAGQLSLSKLQVISDNGDVDFYNTGTAAKDLGAAGLKKFSSILTVSSDPVALPIGFELFTAQRKNADVQLNWKTGNADEAASFDVMRSDNGKDYGRIGTVPALHDQTTYAFTDAGAPASRLYYRIRANELAGGQSYSTVRVIAPDGAGNALVKVYPNPVTNGLFTITTPAGLTTVNVYNSIGILYRQITFTGTAKDIPTTGWAKGTYLLKIVLADGTTTTSKLILQ